MPHVTATWLQTIMMLWSWNTQTWLNWFLIDVCIITYLISAAVSKTKGKYLKLKQSHFRPIENAFSMQKVIINIQKQIDVVLDDLHSDQIMVVHVWQLLCNTTCKYFTKTVMFHWSCPKQDPYFQLLATL